jgi:signal transduction histidine kinase
MTDQRARALAGGSFALSLTLCAATVVYLVRAWDTPTLPTEFGVKGFGIAFALVMGGVGAVVAARRPSNPIGWIFCGIGVISGVLAFSTEYARWAVVDEGARPAGALYAAWLQEWLWIPLVAGLAIVAGIFPDGRFLSPGWRRAIWIATLAATVPTVMTALTPRLTIFVGHDNPVGIGGDAMASFVGPSVALLLPLMFLGAASAVARFRRSRGEERQQLKWLTLAMSLMAVMIAFYGVISLAAGGTTDQAEFDWSEYVVILSFMAVPVSIAFGVLKYRLYDIDFVINKAVVYGVLGAFITLVYVAVVVGIGAAIGTTSNAFLSAVAAAIVALAFQPARRRAQRLANRVVYGERATPYEVLAQLGDRLAGEYAADDVLFRVASILAGGVAADLAAVWLHVGNELRPAAVWPAGTVVPTIRVAGDQIADEIEGTRVFAVRQQGETLGAIGIRKPATDPLTPADEKLVTDLAAQAGLVLRNVRLIEDVRGSRRRLVEAQDHERRKIERNLHDGAQQQLVALTVQLGLLERVAEDPERVRTMASGLQTALRDALDDLRDLARGIYPPLLADKGLREALESHSRKAAVPTTVEADGIGRHPQEVEAAIYFCVLEALQNTAKYAEASHATIRLAERDGEVTFEVEDDGRGFDRSATSYGTGMQGMLDRLEALGGGMEVDTAPGRGTVVRGRLRVA